MLPLEMDFGSHPICLSLCSFHVATGPWRRLLRGLLAAALALGLASVADAQSPGTPDPSFTAGTSDASHFGVQPDGKIVYGSAYSLPINRVNADGTLDASFSPAPANGFFLALQPDGKILTVIHATNITLGSTLDTVLRLNADGSLDTGFTSYSPGHAINLATVQPDGKILVSGFEYSRGSTTPYYLTRLNPDGSVDSSFAGYDRGNEIFYATIAGYSTVTVQPDGKVIVTGNLLGAYATSPTGIPYQIPVPIRRLNADGSPDTSFIYPGDIFRGQDIVLQSDGKILIGSETYANATNPTQGVFRLNADGSFDDGFHATTDLAVAPNPNYYAAASSVNALALQPDGKVIIGGFFDHVDGVALNNLARLNTDGSLDTTFANANPVGVVGTLALQGDGKVLAGGTEGLVRLYAYTPVTTSAGTAAGTAGQPFTYQITANNAPASFSASPLPEGLTLDAATGLITGTPTQAAIVRITLGTLDATSTLTGTGLLTLTVAPVSPMITSVTTASGRVGQPFSYQIIASNSPVSFTAGPLPGGLSLDSATGLVTGTPTQMGTFGVILGAVNGTGTNTSMGTGLLTLTVAPAFPTVTLTATVPQVTANSGNSGEFTLSLSAAQDHDLYVDLTIKGSAINGGDYALVKTTKKIKAGKTSKPIRIIPQGEGPGPGGKRVVTLLLAPGAEYTIGTTDKVKVRIYGQ